MKKLLILFILACGCCPPKKQIEFVNKTKNFKTLSEDYMLQSIIITEYVPKENYIEEVDSNRTIITFDRPIKEVKLSNLPKNYIVKGKRVDSILKLKYLQFKIQIVSEEDLDRHPNFNQVYFVSEQVTANTMVFETGGCK